jgi:hypothetical protein
LSRTLVPYWIRDDTGERVELVLSEANGVRVIVV